jgi:hypothetical protein
MVTTLQPPPATAMPTHRTAMPTLPTWNPPVINAAWLSEVADIPAEAIVAPARPASRKSIRRSQYVRPATMSPAERSALVDQTYGVYSETVGGWTRDEFEAEVISAGVVRLMLYYGADDELAGFSSAKIERVSVGARTHAVFCAFVYFRLGYRGGVSAALFGFRQAMLFRLREPRTPLAYLTRSSSPAVYRLLASNAARLYPSPQYSTPDEVEEVVRVLSERRNYVAVGENPWVVRSAATPRDARRLRRLESDPHVRFYTELNPRFAEGQALLTWIPLDLTNIIVGVLRTLKGRLAK